MTKALVLSGGGPVGIAWQTGLAVGLGSKGVDLAKADLVVGTSAGSAVGAQLALGHDLSAQIERYRTSTPERTKASAATGGAASTGERIQTLMRIMASASGGDATPEEGRAAIGRFAVEADTAPEESFVAAFSYLADEDWPRHYACTAVDVESGAFVVWDENAGAPLDRAVASSCAVPGIFPPITINGRRYMDGGMRSGSNADLAKGHDTVLLVSLMSAARAARGDASVDARLARYRARMEAEGDVLAESGSTLHTVGPDDDAAAVIGMNLMDGSISPAAAEAGVRQGERIAADIDAFWAR